MTGSLAPADRRDLARAEGYAREVVRQIGFLRLNGAGDESRWWLIGHAADQVRGLAQRGLRRDKKRLGQQEPR